MISKVITTTPIETVGDAEAERWQGLHARLSPSQFLGVMSVSDRRAYCAWRFRGWEATHYVLRTPEEKARSKLLGRSYVLSPEGLVITCRIYRRRSDDCLQANIGSLGSVVEFLHPLDSAALNWWVLNGWLEGEVLLWPGSRHKALASIRSRLRL